MTTQEKAPEPSARRVPLAVTVFVMLIAIVLAEGSGRVRLADMFDGRRSVFNVTAYLFYQFFYMLLVLAFVRGHKLARPWLPVLLIFVAAYGIVLLIGQFYDLNIYGPHNGLDITVMTVQQIAHPGQVIPAMLLLACRFQGGWDRVRIAGLVLLLATTLLSLIEGLVRVPGFVFIYVPVSILMFAAMAVSLWCVAFRQVVMDRVPADSGRRVAMTCPRCAEAITVGTGRDECPHCRLQIAIALEDGRCRRCDYSLRGLTSERCPECGEVIAACSEPAGV